MMSIFKRIAVLAAAVVLVSCGGGGSDSGTTPFGGGSGGGTGGGGGGTVATVADLVVAVSKSTVANTGSDSVIVTTTALDAARNTIAGATLQVAADSDAVVSTAAAVTGADGKLQSTLTIGANRANRLITLTVTSGAVTKTSEVLVFGATLSGTLVPAVLSPGGPGKIQFRLLDQATNPMVGQAVNVVAAGLTPASATGTTGTNGDYEFAYTAPAAAGSYTVTATAGGATINPPLVVLVQAANSVAPVTATITSASVSANPSVVGTNVVGSTTNRSEIRALFLGAANAPIKDVRVRFDLSGDVNSIGGTFTSGSTTLFSDANGLVTTAYIPGARSSPTDGVTVRACYGKTDTDPNLVNCTTSSLVRLTVSSEPLGVSIGTNELIIVNELTFAKKFLVSVADAAGNAKADVNLTVSLDLIRYRKGYYSVAAGKWTKVVDHACVNEDTNRNGVLEVGEDVDNDNRLDPGKSDVTVSLLQTKTRADGTAELQILYAKSFGSWVEGVITVAASGVSGTEGRVSYTLAPVPVDAASVGNVATAPAYADSPYGLIADCTNKN